MEKEYNKYLWSPKQPRVYGISPLTISGTPMSEEDVATSLKVENSQQRFQQNPIVKRSEQWEAQQKQREEEIAASKKWLELHPEDESDSPYTILERGKHQAIVDGKDPSYYEKMIDDGKQFTKGALAVLSLPYLSAAAAGAYGYGASLGARGLFAGQGIYGLANKDGVRKTANLIKSGDYGRAALSGAGDALNAAMVLPGAKLLGSAAKFLGSTAKYGLKSTIAGNMLSKNVRYNAPNMETVADYTNKQIFDDLMKYPNKEYNDIPVYTDLNTMKIKKVKNPELVKFEFSPSNFGESVQLEKAVDEFGNNVFLRSFDPSQGRYVDKTFLNGDQKFIHYRATEGYDGKTLFPKADNKVDPVGHIWFNANSSAHSFPDKYKLEHFAIDPIPSTGHPWSESFRLVSDPVDVSNAIHTKYNPITLGLETQIKPFTPLKNTSMDKTSYAFFERPSKLSEAERLDVPKDLSPNISRSLGFSSTTGEELFTPNEILGEFVSGKNQAAKFFQQPVVQNSYAHNKELANRLGINIADRPENISEIVGAPIKLSPYIQNPGNELANIAQSYLGDPSATLSIAWTPFSKRVAKLTGIHEGLHRGHYAQVIKPAPPITKNYYETTMRPEATFWNWKINKLLKPEYQNGYLGGPFDGEAGVNLIEMGRDIGVKLGAKYPGDEVFMNMINNYNGHKSFLIPHLNLDTRAGRRHVWDAMTGQYFKQGGILKRVESGKSGIHIKPENRGKLTRLKKRTGKSEAELWKEGNPAVRKMITFARNARKWKH